jgi:hypothetical protein
MSHPDPFAKLREISAKQAAAEPERSQWTQMLPVRDLLGDLRPPVGRSPDLTRIVNLARRAPPDLKGVDGAALAAIALMRWSRGERVCRCQLPKDQKRRNEHGVEEYGLGRTYCIQTLFPLQAWALQEMSLVGGLIGALAVGSGKTTLGILAPMAIPNCRQAVLFIPPNLRDQTRAEYLAIAEHWHVPSIVSGDWSVTIPGRPVLHVVPYSIFSRQEATVLLDRYKPDLIIADEAHCLRSPRTSARARRFVDYMMRNRGRARFCGWSGTLAARSLKDFAHLLDIALGERSPLPRDLAVVEEWALAADPIPHPCPPGELEVFGLPVRDGLRRRIVETLGVVASAGASIDTPLRMLRRVPPKMPGAVDEAFAKLHRHRMRPDDQELVDDLEVTAAAQQISCGFYYRWRFPRLKTGEETPDLIDAWYAARKAWGQELRDRLAHARPHLDSPALCTAAAIRAHAGITELDERGKPLPNWKALSWPAWRDIKDRVKPVTGDAVWLDDWLAHDAARFALERPLVVWCQYNAFGRRVAELANLPYYQGGKDAVRALGEETGRRSVIVSSNAFGTGYDGLQYKFFEQLVANPISSGQRVEQLLGRLSRPGQRAAEVAAWGYDHTPEFRDVWNKAMQKSAFIDAILHAGQRMMAATGDLVDDSLEELLEASLTNGDEALE